MKVLGPGTLTVANLVNNLAATLTALGRHAEAEHAFREAFEQHVALLGESHWRVRNLARNIGVVVALQQRYDEALPWMDRAAAIRRTPSSSEDSGLEGVRAQRAWIVFQLGRREEALDDVTRAVSALEQMKDSNAEYWLAFVRVDPCAAIDGDGTTSRPRRPARAALAWFERWGPSHPKYADAECQLGRAQMLQGKTAEGRAALEHCLPVYRAWGQADRELVASIERLLADSAASDSGLGFTIRDSYNPSVQIVSSAPTRIDLAGGTIDIWPLYLFHDGASTLNAAISLRAHARVDAADRRRDRAAIDRHRPAVPCARTGPRSPAPTACRCSPCWPGTTVWRTPR